MRSLLSEFLLHKVNALVLQLECSAGYARDGRHKERINKGIIMGGVIALVVEDIERE